MEDLRLEMADIVCRCTHIYLVAYLYEYRETVTICICIMRQTTTSCFLGLCQPEDEQQRQNSTAVTAVIMCFVVCGIPVCVAIPLSPPARPSPHV